MDIIIFIVIMAVFLTPTAILVKEYVELSRENRYLRQLGADLLNERDKVMETLKCVIHINYIESCAPMPHGQEKVEDDPDEEKHCDTDAAI